MKEKRGVTESTCSQYNLKKLDHIVIQPPLILIWVSEIHVARQKYGISLQTKSSEI